MGDVLSAFGNSGSAPREARRSIKGASAPLAAIRKGVAPIIFRVVRPTFAFFVIRAFTFAPCAINCFTRSRLERFPEPSGAGSLSPRPGLRKSAGLVCEDLRWQDRHSQQCAR